MKLFLKKEMQELERAASQAGPSLREMMERAGAALAQTARERFGVNRRAVILCGRGNNGGDGFVAARRLREMGVPCTVILVQGEPGTDLARDAFSGPQGEALLPGPQAEEALRQAGVIVDCLYGFGFRGELDPVSARYTELANAADCCRISADLPSGAECDSGRVSPHTFRAHVTVAFTAQKPAHQSYPAKEFCGEVLVRSVGIPEALINAFPTQAELTGPEQTALPSPDVQANKGSLGRLLLVAGSWGMAGACAMAARAALRCGVGLLNILCTQRLYPILAPQVPEAVFTLTDGSPEEVISALESSSACVLGCGLGREQDKLIRLVLERCRVPLLVDADGLNFCAATGFDLQSIPAPHLITPHPGEASRLLGVSVREIQMGRIPAALSLAERSGGTALLKGAGTVIASPGGRLALNPTGNPGMAKGGSGDVLSGMIGSLLAQGLDIFSAAQIGAYLHGLAGDQCRDKLSRRAMLPTDLTEALPDIFKNFERD